MTEARVTARLEHPGVVPIYELGRRDDGSIYYAMKRVRGRSLEDALESCSSLNDRLSLLPHLLDVVQTIAFAHSKGVIHRDLKPANVMVGSFGETQVLDWGLARVRGSSEPATHGGAPMERPASASQTMHGQVMGTPTHMSPEQARGETAAVDEKSDVWSLGVMLFETLTGRLPFAAVDGPKMLEQVQRAKVPKVRELEGRAPAAIAAIVERALNRDLEARFPTAVEMAEALEQAMGASNARAGSVPMALAAIGFSIAAAVLAGLWLSASGREDEANAKVSRVRYELEVSRAGPLARLAEQSLQQRDFGAAQTVAGQSLAMTHEPKAAGVLAIARSTAHPIRKWSARTEAGCSSVSASGRSIACATFGGVELFSAESGELQSKLSVGPTGWQRAVVFLPDEPILLSGGDDRLVHVWDARDQKKLADWPGHSSPITAMAITASGARLATGSLDGEVRTWERATGVSTLVTKLDGSVRALAFAADGRLAMSTQHQAWLWKLDSKTAPITLDHAASAFFISGGQVLAAVERAVFPLEPAAPRKAWRGPLDDITGLLRTVDGAVIAGDARGELWAWDDEGAVISRTSGFEPGIRAIAPADDSMIVVATVDKRLEGWRWQKPMAVPSMGNPTAFHYDSRLIIGQRSGEVWRSTLQQGFETLKGRHTAPVRVVASAGNRVLSGGDDGRVLLHDLSAESVTELIEKPKGRVTALTVSGDGQSAAWSLDDGTRTVFNLQLMKEISSGVGPISHALAFSRDGNTLAFGSDDKRVTIVEALTGRERATLEGLDGAITALSFSPDGSWLAVGAEQNVQLVDLLKNRVATRLVGPHGRVGLARFFRQQRHPRGRQ